LVDLIPEIRECVFKRLSINGFSVWPQEEEGKYMLTVRGEHPTSPNRILIQETEEGFKIIAAYGGFRRKKKLLQDHIDHWVISCSLEIAEA